MNARIKWITCVLSAMVFCAVTAHAQTSVWTGAVDNNWSSPGNWLPAGVPNGNTYTVMVETASATINVDGAYTINSFLISSNSVSSGSTVSLDGTGPLTVDINFGAALNETAAGFNNDTLGIGTVLEVNCDVIIDNTLSGRTRINQGGGTNNVVRFGPDCTLTINNDLLSNDPDGQVEFNCTLLGTAFLNLWNRNHYFGTGYDDSGFGNIIVAAGTSILTFNGGTVTAGNRVQVNAGNCTLVFNAANVASNLNIRGNGASSAFHLVVNASQDNMGYLDVGGQASTIDPVGGTLWFQGNSAGETWIGGSLTISTNFSFGDIRFGTTSNALTELQLLDISADGVIGAALLDVDGYLKFEGPPPVITGEMIVDYDTNGGNTNSRPADIISSNGYTWAFSETEPLFINSGQNRTIYGGVTSTWSVATNYVPQLVLTNGQIWAQINPTNSSEITAKAMYVWPKEEFLLGSNGTLSFTNGNAMSFAILFQWGGGLSRFVVKQGGIYYASDASAASGSLVIDPSDPAINWAPISTNDYTIGSYGPITFTDIEAVGITYDYFKLSTAPSGVRVTYNDFRVRANVYVPPPTEISDVSIAAVNGGSQVVVSWQGTNTATYALQTRTDLASGDWNSVVTNMAGINGLMSVTNDTTDPEAYFRTLGE